ncbi:MAG: choice-of-anchor D domain-containing protein, partial [Candidatus Acidiferrales bacterium]
NTGRAETVQILDAASNTVLDSRNISNFTTGIYLVWTVSGDVKINVIATSGPNAVISGIFFGGNSSTAPSAPVVILPVVTTQPVSQGVFVGQTATFSIADTGTAPVTYQWEKNGAAISGATSSSYTTPPTVAGDKRSQFSVVVSNSAGSTISSAAILTVNPGTLLLSSSSMNMSFGNVNVSSDSMQNITLTSTGNANVTISSVSVSGAGFNAGGVPSGSILSPGQTATLNATFAPAAAGSATGTVTVSSNASNGPQKIALSGTGMAQITYSVDLSWAASTSTVTGYNVYFSIVSGGPYQKLTATPVATMSYMDPGVSPGETRYYVVTAVNSGNVESGFSSEVSAIIP